MLGFLIINNINIFVIVKMFYKYGLEEKSYNSSRTGLKNNLLSKLKGC